jgi:hypothetical protein
MPEHYTYFDWAQEPFALKWYVLGLFPIIRFIPIVFALCAGSILLVFLLDVSYPIALVVFVVQFFIDLIALFILSFAFNLGIAIYSRSVAEAELRQRIEEIEVEKEADRAPRNLRQLRHRIANLGPGQGSHWRQIDPEQAPINRSAEPFYSLLRPITRHLPLPAQNFLESGGWFLVIPGMIALALYWPRIHRGRTRLHHHRRKRRPIPADQPGIELAEIGDCITGLGAKQVMVQGVPGRIRLIVLVPAASVTVVPPEGTHAPVLDAAFPGLSGVTATDFPKVVYWLDPRARDNFRAALAERVKMPEAADEGSRWVLVAGDVAAAAGALHLALAIRTEKPPALRFVEVPASGWNIALGIRVVPVEEQGL